MWFCLFKILSVCLHDKTEAAETIIAKFGTGIVQRDISRPPIILGQKVKAAKLQSAKNIIKGNRIKTA